ncbi:putative defensin-like protein 180 [Capsella rubella]|uniref:putative defensin-like protein 180 n=1 Tax=Capsella rubella TaxID=81985 RepID=UPI000CD59C07|nr:putative defensin-like protein 180 [Capsella rubella]
MTTSLVFLVSLLVIFVAVVNQTRADSCNDSLGTCENCDERCKTKHGPSTMSKCDGSVGLLLCTCTYECAPLASSKICSGGTGLCTADCPEKCCDTNCAEKYNSGRGSCNFLGNYNLCQCEYKC